MTGHADAPDEGEAQHQRADWRGAADEARPEAGRDAGEADRHRQANASIRTGSSASSGMPTTEIDSTTARTPRSEDQHLGEQSHRERRDR